MRVLMISKACLVGQYQTKLESLARAPGVELTVVVPPSWRDERGELRLERAHTQGYRLIVAPIRFNGNFHLHYYPTIGRILRESAPDVLHVDEEAYNFATTHILSLARRASPRAHSLFFTWQNLKRTYPLPFSAFESYVYARVDRAIAGSESAARVLEQKGFRKPIAVIPQFGVDETTFAPASARTPGRSFTIAYAGRLVEEKGVDLLLRALAGLRGDWCARIVGSGPQRASLEQLARTLSISERVAFEPPRPSVDMPAFFHEVDALVLPSRSRPNWIEQFGRVLIEAMACEVPVVGSSCGEIPNVIGDAGPVFAEGDVNALATALQSLLDSPERAREYGRLGRARVLARWTQREVAERTAQVYREIMTGG